MGGLSFRQVSNHVLLNLGNFDEVFFFLKNCFFLVLFITLKFARQLGNSTTFFLVSSVCNLLLLLNETIMMGDGMYYWNSKKMQDYVVLVWKRNQKTKEEIWCKNVELGLDELLNSITCVYSQI